MAHLGRKNGVYLARFRYGGREYKRSLKTADRRDAEAALVEVRRVLHRLTVGLLHVPAGTDPGDFIVSGGTRTAPAPVTPPKTVPTLRGAADEYLANLAHMAESNRVTTRVHLGNLLKALPGPADDPVDRLAARDLERFLQARLRDRAATTAAKERATVIAFLAWAVRQGWLAASPATDLTKVKLSGDLPPFRTYAEVEAVIARGGLSDGDEAALWDALYLTPAEVGEVLGLVRARARHGVSYVLHALAAYTGMRRGEILRLRWEDIEFDRGMIWARSRKQSRQAAETKRRIDLHPDLREVLQPWKQGRPRGQYVACDDGTLDPLNRHQAGERFEQPLRGTRWSLPARNYRTRLKIGYHTYRHSFASTLAAAGVDQRVIDEFLGHTTEAMRRRYRHLFPQHRREAIEVLKFPSSDQT